MPDAIQIHANFPGGNVTVDSIDGLNVRLHPDLRDTPSGWFYWHFGLKVPKDDSVAGRAVQISLGDAGFIGSTGPCVSFDLGNTWSWLGREAVEGDRFHFVIPAELAGGEVRFAVGIPYVQSDLDVFYAARPEVERSHLAISEKGRPIELISLLSARGTFVVPITARLHACEAMGNYVLEGILDAWLNTTSADGEFLREHVDLRAVPFFDVDGVALGDQGKNRAPHDHNRDFIDQPIYVATRAFQQALQTWRGRAALAIDLHCPALIGGRNEELFLVGSPAPWAARELEFTQTLQDIQQGELHYNRNHTIAAGKEWNNPDAATLTRYVRTHSAVAFAAPLEIPYATAGGQTMTPANTRAFGADVGRAIGRYIRLYL